MPKIKEHKPSIFAQKLIELRKARQLTQSELAEKLGMSTSGIAYYEATSKNPRLTTIQKIADFFNVSPDFLLSDVDANKNIPQSRIDKISEELKSMSAYKQKQACNLIETLIAGLKK